MTPVGLPVFQKGCCRSIACSTHRRERPSESFCGGICLSFGTSFFLGDRAPTHSEPEVYFCRLRFGLRPDRHLIESESSERKSGRQNDLNVFGRVNKIPKQVLVRFRACRVGGGVIALVDHIR